MGDGVLSCDDGAVFETGGDVIAEIGIDYGNDVYAFWYCTDGSEKVNGTLK